MKRITYSGSLLAVMVGTCASAAYGQQQECERDIEQLQSQLQQEQVDQQLRREIEQLLSAAEDTNEQECRQIVAEAREQLNAAQRRQSQQVAQAARQQQGQTGAQPSQQQPSQEGAQAQRGGRQQDETTEVQVEQPAPEIEVQQPAADVVVEQPPPEVEITQPEPEVQVRQGEPQVTVDQAEPDVQVRQAEPDVRVRESAEEPDVRVVQPDEQRQAREQQRQTEQQRQPGQQREMTEAEAAELVGSNVIGAQGEDVGEVHEVARSSYDSRLHALVDVGGFLGIGERTVAIPLENAAIDSEGNLRIAMTREELERMPEVEEDQYATIEEQGGRILR